jgi:phosphoglycerate dehydrogenase-like enzyme
MAAVADQANKGRNFMRQFRVVASGDFLKPDGTSAFPEFSFDRLADDPRIEFRFLPTASEIAKSHIADADALVLSDGRITADSFDPGGRLALIAQFGAGFNHIDLAAATRHGVAVTNTPHGVRRPVAVSILTLIFALTTRLFVKASLTGRGPAGWAEVTRHNGVGLTGKTLGSIGVGNIGAEMFRLAAPLGMKFLAHDPYETVERAGALGVELTGLDDLFRRADILCVNCPLNAETRHIVSAARLALMKPTAYLINTSRGGTVDQGALTELLAAKRIAGAALDVFEQEPPDPADPIFALDNVILTPHALCWTDELFAGCGRDAVQSVLDALAGKAPTHIVNPAVTADAAWRRKLESFARRSAAIVT